MDGSSSTPAKRIQLIISEPWDAYGSIIGTVIGTIRAESSSKVHLLLETMTPQRYLLVAERYAGDDVSAVLRGEHMVVTVARVRDVHMLQGATYRQDQVEFFAIGSAQILDES